MKHATNCTTPLRQDDLCVADGKTSTAAPIAGTGPAGEQTRRLAPHRRVDQGQRTKHQVCARCVCDTTIPEIRFDDRGICQFCHRHDRMEAEYPLDEQGSKNFQSLIKTIQKAGRGKKYDCIVGVSGGRDSTYLLYQAVKAGLRPLAVHFDNGWNSEIAVTNIRNAIEILGIDLHTHVADWQEFKDLQLAFLKASVSDADIPTDVAIFGTLHKAASQEGVRYILNGHSFRTEGVMPKSWTYMDGRYINSVHRQFGTVSKKSVPNFTLVDLAWYTFFRRIQCVPFLNFFDYDHDNVGEILEREMGWTYYGGHHHESYYTHFFQSHWLPNKFGIDKRKIEYSALIRSGRMTRQAAFDEVTTTEYPDEEQLVDYVLNKFEIDREEFEEMRDAPPKSFHDYPTYFPLINTLKTPVKYACRWKLLPELLYEKYLG